MRGEWSGKRKVRSWFLSFPVPCLYVCVPTRKKWLGRGRAVRKRIRIENASLRPYAVRRENETNVRECTEVREDAFSVRSRGQRQSL